MVWMHFFKAFSIQLDLFNHGIRFLIERVLLDPRIRDVRWPSKELAEIEHLLLPPGTKRRFCKLNLLSCHLTFVSF